ncbi:hypothetical protein BASA60_001697 [Batrachochytrium salamandrivorans]|nr:hypothetical protein BASA60_001697 [Batrachochytrium salamandrivorans]
MKQDIKKLCRSRKLIHFRRSSRVRKATKIRPATPPRPTILKPWMVERMHAMMGHAIILLVPKDMSRDGMSTLQQTIFALRVRKHAVTNKSPFYLLYGVEPRLPGDDSPIKDTMQPLDNIEEMMERAELTAREFDELGMARGAAYHRSVAQAKP